MSHEEGPAANGPNLTSTDPASIVPPPADPAELTPEQARELLSPFADMSEKTLSRMPAELVKGMVDALGLLPVEERMRWLRGRRVALYRAIQGAPFASRSQAYQAQRALPILMLLHREKLVDLDEGCRDVETGRKVRSLVYELARINWANDEAILGTYRNLRGEPLAVVKAVIREHNPRVQTLDSAA